jgi:hypothetical protein
MVMYSKKAKFIIERIQFGKKFEIKPPQDQEKSILYIDTLFWEQRRLENPNFLLSRKQQGGNIDKLYSAGEDDIYADMRIKFKDNNWPILKTDSFISLFKHSLSDKKLLFYRIRYTWLLSPQKEKKKVKHT